MLPPNSSLVGQPVWAGTGAEEGRNSVPARHLWASAARQRAIDYCLPNEFFEKRYGSETVPVRRQGFPMPAIWNSLL